MADGANGPGGPGSDELVITGGGTTLVATDSMLAYLDRLRLLVEDLDAARARLASADRIGDWRAVAGAPSCAVQSESALDDARHAVHVARDRAELLASSVSTAVGAYTEAERLTKQAQSTATGFAVAELGPLLLLAGAALLPAAALGAADLWKRLPGTEEQRREMLKSWLIAHPELITNPAFVEFVRGIAMHTDNLLWSAVVPGPIAALLGDETIGVTGVESTAIGLLGVGGLFGLFRESGVSVTRVATEKTTSAAVGSEERLSRVPEVDQVRVEKYEAPGAPPRFTVYVGPTETFSPAYSDEPWDLTSNVGGVAGLPVGSFQATELAMADAGIEPGSEVQFVGFSQGGLVASMVAASGHWNAQGLETYGAPAGNIPLDGDLPGMAVRNTDDFVPALAGEQLDETRLQVERQAYPGDIPTDIAAPAHQKRGYLETAREIDDAASPEVRTQIAAMDDFAGDYLSRDGSSVTVMKYRAERLDPSHPAVGIG